MNIQRLWIRCKKTNNIGLGYKANMKVYFIKYGDASGVRGAARYRIKTAMKKISPILNTNNAEKNL